MRHLVVEQLKLIGNLLVFETEGLFRQGFFERSFFDLLEGFDALGRFLRIQRRRLDHRASDGGSGANEGAQTGGRIGRQTHALRRCLRSGIGDLFFGL